MSLCDAKHPERQVYCDRAIGNHEEHSGWDRRDKVVAEWPNAAYEVPRPSGQAAMKALAARVANPVPVTAYAAVEVIKARPVAGEGTLAAEQARLFDLRHEGTTCKACGQFSKVYRRTINSGMARSLIVMERAAGIEWVHVPTVVGGRSREEGKLRYWGLVEEELTKRPDGGRAGYWRLTEAGKQFVHRALTVRKYALIYDSELVGMEGEQVSIIDALGDKFNYEELMSV